VRPLTLVQFEIAGLEAVREHCSDPVVALAGELAAETFPAASSALIVYE
jgi:hypothetical protein